ncbi:hypothetical protein QBC36DRAFT_340593 [Triangularia setosa]|uniref:Uncharacterized protein n=1 Tax=Triangularia setosa TaxID=2587417 RepID=A0AAN7A2N4_9PEZI|nr:hypothetical protein QBC36DRAFT_340593 [Podospora setosa]
MSSGTVPGQADDLGDNTQPWGSLPVEQYILQKWDANSALSIEDQRDALVNAFINEDVIGPEYQAMTHTPTEQEIITILESWRSQKVRAIAAKHSSNSWLHFENEGFYVLRTSYQDGKEDGEKLNEWLGYDELKGLSEADIEDTLFDRSGRGEQMIMHPKDRWWMVLDDKELFDVDDADNDNNWQAVYSIFPELAAPSMDRRFDMNHAIDTLVLSPNRELSEDDYEDAVLEAASRRLHYPLIIIDQEAFETSQIYLVWRDPKGNVVKDMRGDTAGLPYLQYDINRLCVHEVGWWTEACFGKLYSIYGKKGKLMRKLLLLLKEEVAKKVARNT